MMIIRINEDGSTSIQAAGYMACYDKEGKPKMTIGDAPQHLIIHNGFNPKAEKEQATIAADSFKVCDSERKVRAVAAPLKLAVDTNANAIINEAKRAFEVACGVHFNSAVINSAKINNIPDDDHIRQIVREEIRQFVNRELRQGGLFSK
ncbi:hypothetical protein [Xenorhabdus griffiniae]|uniref:Phage protein n=1 Tax=Xenorhabdus griffiniae TaxID=351672 RepID=A0ABY9XKT1_9GAMM|nr:hypothetical protein [Xenorhabdus griffiniae]MBD1228330.1 hypothetical protein [Xenorhabdus griffiniae]MBE8587767.1 hypothetical protein [Xenorhabdus griffiniae]WMV73528.1 hypothetical protein QL128_05770 [Xenorhabdus griffiniae]WMV74033.1 hypothetical protein QL128_08580 [Xenorhabdus griffiniae]WNH03208.1 hypothetical protein QL112_005775 [Xenorhabdus griffiniae]